MTNDATRLLLVGTLISVGFQSPGPLRPPDLPLTMRCSQGGGVEISSDTIRITCNKLDLRIPPSALRSIALATEATFVIPLTPSSGIPLATRRDVRLSFQGDDREHTVYLRVEQDDLIRGLAALHYLTRLSVFTERPHDDLTAAGIGQTLGTYSIPPASSNRHAWLDDRSAAAAEMTDAGDVIVVYASGRSVVWNPTASVVRALGDRRSTTASQQRCFTGWRIVGIHQRIAAIVSCDRVTVYDLDSGDVRSDFAIEHPGGVALNGADGALYWLESGKLRRRSLTPGAAEQPDMPLPDRFDQLSFSARGDLMLCSRGWKEGKGATDLYIFTVDGGRPGMPVRLRGLKGHDPHLIAVHPHGGRIVTHTQGGRWSVREIITIWDLHPTPRKAKEVRQPKEMINWGFPRLRYSIDGSMVVVGTSRALVLDAESGKVRCEVSEGLGQSTRPNAEGLAAGIGWEVGRLPRAVVWDVTTCKVRSRLDPPP